MNCKFCSAELEEQNLICPACGKDNSMEEQPEQVVETVIADEAPENVQQAAEEVVEEASEETTGEITAEAGEETVAAEIAEEVPAKPKKKTWKIVVAVVCAAVVLLGAAAAGWWLHNGGSFTPRENDVFYKDSYIAEGNKLDKAMDTVVATMGDRTLTNGELQVYYWMQVYNFLEYYGSSVEIDITKPLAEQMMSDTTSWEQYLLNLSLATWNRYQALCVEAEKAGYALPDDIQEVLSKTAENLETAAKENGFESAEAMIQADMGPGSSLEDYINYMTDYYQGVYFFDGIYNQMDPSEEEISAFFDEHAADFETQYGVTKTSGKLVDVRHILIEPEGAETDANGHVTATEDQWEACRVAAQAILDGWLAGEATEEAFAALAAEHSVDAGSSSNGGLYSAVPTGYMVEAFDAWMFDENRKVGDTGLVKTEFGYHIMYYSGGEEGWVLYGRDALISELCSQRLDEITAENPREVDYKAIVLGQADLSGNMQ